MFLILNRLRGTQGLWSKIIGLLIALVVQIAFNNPYVSIAVGLGYIIGESFGLGLWVGTLSVQREKGYALKDEGEGRNNGIEWLATKIIKPTQENWIKYCRVALAIRGVYWYLPTLAPLYFLGFNPYVLVGCIAFLSITFPFAYDIGYYLSNKFSFEKYGISYKGGWELGEGIVGITQDIILGVLIWTYLAL